MSGDNLDRLARNLWTHIRSATNAEGEDYLISFEEFRDAIALARADLRDKLEPHEIINGDDDGP